MTALTHRRYVHRRHRVGHNPLAAPLLLFGVAVVIAAVYIAYALWPRWPQSQVSLDAPSLPIVISGVNFNIEPAAIRQAIERHPGTQARVDFDYLWPSLLPPDPTVKPTLGAPVDTNERLFVTIVSGDLTMPIAERVREIYPRYLVAEPTTGPDGLTLRRFRDSTPYQGEELAFETRAPEHFLARCSLHGVVNSGDCLLERRIGHADITFRFPRAWLNDWKSVAAGIDKLLLRLHPTP